MHHAQVVEAAYSKPFVLHGSIGPSAAVAHYLDGRLSVWSHSQGVEMLRPALGAALGLDADRITVTHVDGAGCYGHNGADDAALEAALVAIARPGATVRVMRVSRQNMNASLIKHSFAPVSRISPESTS
jgi:CO/xanthine dehydrogenase Mo-binding subunit